MASLSTLIGLNTGPGQDLVLRTARHELRPPALNDYAAWSSLRRESAAFLQPWEPRWPADHLSRTAFRARVRWARREASADRVYAFLIFESRNGALKGGITLGHVRRGPAQSANIGYWVGERHARAGVMSDCLPAIIRFAFSTLGLWRLEAACLEENTASKRLLSGAGFRHEGIARGYLEVEGRRRDHLVYALVR